MNAAATFLREISFWKEVDAGSAPGDTSLFLGTFEGGPLSEALSQRFAITHAQAEFEIHAARLEVEL
jgi:hypothetical protein